MIASTSCSVDQPARPAPASPKSPTTSFASGRDRPAEAGREIVEDDDLLAGVEQLPDHVAADIAGAAGDQNAHATHASRDAQRAPVSVTHRLKAYCTASLDPALPPSSFPRAPNMNLPHPQGRLSGRRPRHALPSRHQGDAEGDADRRRPAADPVGGRRGARGRHRAFHPGHRPQQGGDRGPFRHPGRARGDAARARQERRARRSSPASCRRPAR